MPKKIYLSGKISGDENFRETFLNKETELSSGGDMVFNPVDHPAMFTHGQFAHKLALSFCDSIYFMSSWRSSRGARLEFELAKTLGLEFQFEEPLYAIRSGNGLFFNPETSSFDLVKDDLSAESLFNRKEIEEISESFFDGRNVFSLAAAESIFNEGRAAGAEFHVSPWHHHKTENKKLEKIMEFYEKLKGKEAQEEELVPGKNFPVISAEFPKKTGVGYKVFYLKDGKLYPPMVKNPGGSETPMGVWLDASAGSVSSYSKTGRPQIEKGGPGTHCSKGELAYRPGWHLGDVPVAKQFEKVNPLNGKKELFPAEFVWAECEYACDKDYQEEAMKNGFTKNGSFRHSYAGLQKVPEGGYYRYRTNPDPETEEWIIAGKIKVKRILSDREVDELCIKAGKTPQKREKDVLGIMEEQKKLKKTEMDIGREI